MMPELTDLELWKRLESVNLSNDAFKHREHIRAAFVALSKSEDLAEGALRFRRALKQFAQAQGADQKYNETLTWAYLVLIHERMHRGEFENSQQFLAAYPELLSHRGGVLGRYYDLDAVTRSPVARRLFLLPGNEQLGGARESR
jgi:hypothetical protein